MTAPWSLRLEDLSWREVKDAMENGYDSVIVAAGATEQHGPHMPLCVDAALGEEITLEIARRTGQMLVAPAVRPGVSEHHMSFPGTITLTEETMEAVLQDYCMSLDRHGFKAIVLMVAHGGNMNAVDAVSKRLDGKLNARVLGLVNPFEPDLFIDSKEFGNMIDVKSIGAHGGHAETSLMLAFRPDLVHMEHAVRCIPDLPGDLAEVGRLLSEHGTRGFSESGVLGDGTTANPEFGRALIEEMASNVAAYLRKELAIEGAPA
jgi:creatinine amidohydrolase